MKIGTTALTKVMRGDTAIQKVMRGVTTIWENWTLFTGNLFQMTSNNTPSPFVVTAPTGWYLENAWKFFNNVDEGGTGDWLSGGLLTEAYIDLLTPVKPKSLILKIDRVSNSDLRNIYIEGSNDLSSWDTLYQNLNSSASINSTFQLTDNNKTYRYLRFRMTSSTDGYQDRMRILSITEWYKKG